jgi:hypothetical protein
LLDVNVVAPDVTLMLFAPFNCRTKPLDVSPETVPPIVNGAVGDVVHVTATLVMLALAIAPLPFATVHVCEPGCVNTVTAYAAPEGRELLDAKAPAPEATLMLLAPLTCSTRPGDVSPAIDPPIV